MAVPYFFHNSVYEPAEPVEPLPILFLNSFCAPEANPNAELETVGFADSSNSSEQEPPSIETDSLAEGAGQGRWVNGGAPVQGRRKTPKPFSKGEIIDLTIEDDDERRRPGAKEPTIQEPEVFRRTYTLDDEAIHLIHNLPSPKDKEAMIRHDIMSEVNPNIVHEIIEEQAWDRLSVPPLPRQVSYFPVPSPFAPEIDNRPKYPLSAMHPHGSLAPTSINSPYDHLSRYYDAIATGDPYAEKAIAQMYAAVNENAVLPGHLGKRRRDEPVIKEEEVGTQRLQVYRDPDDAAPPAKKPLLGSHRNTDRMDLKGKAKMGISNLVHGYTSRPAGLFVKPRSKVLKTPPKASKLASSRIEDASLEQQLQDSAAHSWIQFSAPVSDRPLEKKDVSKAKKVRTKNTKRLDITEPVRRSERIRKKIPGGVKV